jgi:hypothetical protein
MPATTQNVTVSNLQVGVYQFGLITQDDKGAFSSESVVTVTVTPANNPSLTGTFGVSDGNSIEAGQGGSFGGPLKMQFQQMSDDLGFNDVFDLTTIAVPGQSTADALSDISTQVVPLYDASKKKNIFFLGEPFNGLRGGASPADEFQRVKTYFETIKAAHPDALCVASTPPPDNSRLSSAPTNPNYEANRQAFATLMRNARAAGVPWLDALADITAETCVDPSDLNLSDDGIHYKPAGQFLYTRRVAYAFREAAYGIAQPAPILKTTDNYVANAAVFTFQRPAANHIVSTSGILTVDAGGHSGYGNLGVDNYYLPAGTAGRVIVKFQDVNDRDAIISFSTSSTPAAYNQFQAAFWFGNGTGIATLDGGQQGSVSETLVGSTFYALYRAVNGTVFLQKSTDLVSWTTIKTYNFTSTADLYVRLDMNGAGRLSYPQGQGFILQAGQSAGGTMGPYTGINEFADNQYLVADGAGNYTAAGNPSVGNWGGVGVNTAYYLAANTAGRLILSINALTGDVIIGLSLSSGKGGYPGIEYSIYIPLARSLKANASGSIVNVANAIANGQQVSLYRNANTGVVTLESKAAGATDWDPLYEFPTPSKGALYPRVDLNQDGTLSPSSLEGFTPR